MNGVDILLIVLLSAVLTGAVRHTLKRRKSGGCGCGCGGCLNESCTERKNDI